MKITVTREQDSTVLYQQLFDSTEQLNDVIAVSMRAPSLPQASADSVTLEIVNAGHVFTARHPNTPTFIGELVRRANGIAVRAPKPAKSAEVPAPTAPATAS